MVFIRRFECALEPTKQKVVEQFKVNPQYPAKAMYRISGFQFYNTSEFNLAELINDPDNLAANFKAYLQSFSSNVQEIIVSAEKGLDFYKQIDKMDASSLKMPKLVTTTLVVILSSSWSTFCWQKAATTSLMTARLLQF